MTPVQLPLPDIGVPPQVPKGYTFVGYNPDGSLRVSDASGKVLTLPADFTGTDENGTYQGGGEQVTTQPVTQVREPTTSAPAGAQANPVRVWTGSGYEQIGNIDPSIFTAARDPRTLQPWESPQGDYAPSMETLVEQYQRQPYTMNGMPDWLQGRGPISDTNFDFSYEGANNWMDQSKTNYLRIKSGDKEGTLVPFKFQNGQWVPQTEGLQTQRWDTNNRGNNLGLATVLGAAALGFGANQLGLLGGAGSPGAAATTGSAAGTTGLPASLGGIEGVIAGSTAAPSLSAGLGTGFAGVAPTTGTLASIVPGAVTGAGAAGITAAAAAANPGLWERFVEATKGMTAADVGKFIKDNASWLAPLVTGAVGAATAPDAPSGSGGSGSPSGIEQSYLDLAREQWLWSKGMDERFAPLYEQLIKDSMADAAKQRERGDLMWGEYQNTYMPLQRRQASEAANWDNPAEVAKREGIAAATVNRQFDQSQGQLDRALAANNVSASSGRAIGSAVEMANARALGTSAARNTTRDEAVLTGMQLRDNAIKTGMAVGGAGLSRDLAATGSGGAATGTMGSQVNTRNASLAPVFSGLGGGLAANNAGFNQAQTNYRNQTDRHDRNMQYGGAVVGGIMSWLSDENAKEDKQPIDPEVVADILAKKVRVEKWKYKDGRGDGKHHIGPYAQEFAAAFGGDGLTIDPMTAVGIALAANKGNTAKIARLERKLEAMGAA